MKNSAMLTTFYRYVGSAVIGMLCISLYIFADTYYIAQGVGADGLTALNLLLPIYNFFNAVAMMIGTGCATIYSLTRKRHIFRHSLYLTGLTALPFTLLGLFGAEQLAVFLGADAVTCDFVATYLRIMLGAAAVFMFNTVLRDFIRNDGHPKFVMFAMISGSLSNIFLDYLFVMVFKWSMAGAAWATVSCQALSLLLLCGHRLYYRQRRSRVTAAAVSEPDGKISVPAQATQVKAASGEQGLITTAATLIKGLSLGLPALVMELSSGLIIMVYNGILLSRQGNLGVAAYAIVANLAMVALAIFYGVSQGVQPLLSDAVYRQSYREIKYYQRQTILLSALLSLGLYLLFLWQKELAVAAFNENNNPVLQAIAENACTLYFIGMIPASFNIFFTTYYAARGEARIAQILSFLRSIILLLPLLYCFAYLFAGRFIWLAFPVTEFLVMATALLLYFRPANKRL